MNAKIFILALATLACISACTNYASLKDFRAENDYRYHTSRKAVVLSAEPFSTSEQKEAIRNEWVDENEEAKKNAKKGGFYLCSRYWKSQHFDLDMRLSAVQHDQQKLRVETDQGKQIDFTQYCFDQFGKIAVGTEGRLFIIRGREDLLFIPNNHLKN